MEISLENLYVDIGAQRAIQIKPLLQSICIAMLTSQDFTKEINFLLLLLEVKALPSLP